MTAFWFLMWFLSILFFGYALNKIAPLLVIMAPFLGLAFTALVKALIDDIFNFPFM